MFTVSIILACLFFCFCNDVVMRYMFLHALLSKTDGRHLDSLFSSPGVMVRWRSFTYRKEKCDGRRNEWSGEEYWGIVKH